MLPGVQLAQHFGDHFGIVGKAQVAAAQRQMAILTTNTRYLHAKLARYLEELSALLPPELSVIYLVNSGSEANDLALRMARNHTGRNDVIVLDHAYHGHTAALIDISPYKFNGPGGRGAPATTHITPMPDAYRGEFRGMSVRVGDGVAVAEHSGAEAVRPVPIDRYLHSLR